MSRKRIIVVALMMACFSAPSLVGQGNAARKAATQAVEKAAEDKVKTGNEQEAPTSTQYVCAGPRPERGDTLEIISPNYSNSDLANAYATEEAVTKKPTGEMLVRMTVDTDGTLHDIQVIKGLGYGMDEAWVRYLEREDSRFPPVRNQDGKPVCATIKGIFRFNGLRDSDREKLSEETLPLLKAEREALANSLFLLQYLERRQGGRGFITRYSSIGTVSSAAEILAVLNHPFFSHDTEQVWEPSDNSELARKWLVERIHATTKSDRWDSEQRMDRMIVPLSASMAEKQLAIALRELDNQDPKRFKLIATRHLEYLSSSQWKNQGRKCYELPFSDKKSISSEGLVTTRRVQMQKDTDCVSWKGTLKYGGYLSNTLFLTLLLLKEAHPVLKSLLDADEKAYQEKRASEKNLLSQQEQQNAIKALELEKVNASAIAAWRAYDARPKTVLEQALNYTSIANVNGEEGYYWISGAKGQNKCVMTSVVLRSANEFVARISALSGIAAQTIDLREMNQVGFRLFRDRVGDENFKLLRSASAVDERLRNAWRLAFAECPSREKAPF